MNEVKVCLECGCEFVAKAHNSKFCSFDCRKAHAKKAEAKAKASKKLRLMNVKSLAEIQWEIKEYNEKHGTNLSYGQYVTFVEGRATV
jgi:hypothetical protein